MMINWKKHQILFQHFRVIVHRIEELEERKKSFTFHILISWWVLLKWYSYFFMTPYLFLASSPVSILMKLVKIANSVLISKFYRNNLEENTKFSYI